MQWLCRWPSGSGKGLSLRVDLARDRLGLLALARWEQARDGGNGKALSDLPLFALP